MKKANKITLENFVKEGKAYIYSEKLVQMIVAEPCWLPADYQKTYNKNDGKLFFFDNYLQSIFIDVDSEYQSRVFGYSVEEDVITVNEDEYSAVRTISAEKNKRLIRAKLFIAFDTYKTNIQYGINTETAVRHEEIIKWYKGCLDLNENNINNPPAEISRYL